MKKIVLVEDDAAIRDSFGLMLDAEKYQLKTYLHGTPILNSEVDTPDLFILDRNVSGLSGLNLCSFIKHHEKYRNVPVIIISASPDIVELAGEVGADDVIEKPFSIKLMKEKIAGIVAFRSVH